MSSDFHKRRSPSLFVVVFVFNHANTFTKCTICLIDCKYIVQNKKI